MVPVKQILKNYKSNNDGIYGNLENSNLHGQEKEIHLRNQVADKIYNNYLLEISNHHSIGVMDLEVASFLKKLPKNSVVCDIGGCWGWHWRYIKDQRPDVRIIIVDFVRKNLNHAKNVLGKLIDNQIYLVNGDANNLRFDDNTFNAVFSVQTIQHIPNYKNVYYEIFRILKNDAYFYNYNLKYNFIFNIIYKILRKKYQRDEYDKSFFQERVNAKQRRLLSHAFDNKVLSKYSELLFHPDLKLTFTGNKNSNFGIIDYYLGKYFTFLKFIARQECLVVKKK